MVPRCIGMGYVSRANRNPQRAAQGHGRAWWAVLCGSLAPGGLAARPLFGDALAPHALSV